MTRPSVDDEGKAARQILEVTGVAGSLAFCALAPHLKLQKFDLCLRLL
jgi:hypothetical protein